MKIFRLFIPFLLIAATAYGQVSLIQPPGTYTDTSLIVRDGTYNKTKNAPTLLYATSLTPGQPNSKLTLGDNSGDTELLLIGASTAGSTGNVFSFELHDAGNVLTQASLLTFDLGLTRWSQDYWSTLSGAYVESFHFDPATNVTTFTNGATAPTWTSTATTGTAPFVVASTTLVANLHAATADSATTTTTATNATNIGITNDTTTNATMYPLWVTANTGNLPAKVSSTKLSFNPSTGILASTGFAGSLAGGTALPVSGINATGTPSSSTFLRGDGTWNTPAGGGNVSNTGTPTSGQAAEWTSATVIQGVGVTGTVDYVKSTSPTLVTPILGVAAATSINKVAITAPATSATLTIANGKTLTANNTLTLAGTDSTTMTFPTTSATLARTDAANTFTGTQTIGALVATTVNGNTITTGSSTFTGTAAQTYTFPTTTASIARTDAGQTFAGNETFSGTITGTAAFPQITLGANTTTKGGIKLFGNTSGDVTLAPLAVAGTSTALTFPATSGGLIASVTAIGTVTGTPSSSNFLRGDGTWATPAGSGTVTVVSAGSLTSTALVTGGGTTTLQTPSATATMDSSGNISTPGTLTVGSGATTAGAAVFTQGTTQSAGTTNITLQAPTAVTSYVMTLPGAVGGAGTVLTDAAGNGVLSWAAGGGTGTVTHTGSLTSNAVVLGNGTADTKVVAGITTDGTSQLTLGVNTTTLGKVKLFGNTSGDATIQPAAVAGTSTVVTLPNASSTLPIFGQQITFAGPTAARTVTFPDAAFTVARTDAANTFTGVQTMTSPAFTTSITTASTSFTALAGATTLLTFGGTGASASTLFPSTLDTSSSITGAIRTSGGISAAKALNIGTTITGGGNLTIGTSNSATVGTIELGAASDTTLSRSAAGVIAVEGNIVSMVGPRITTITSNANPTYDTRTCDLVNITAQAAAITSMTTNGTITGILDGQQVEFRIKDDGTARAITWGANFASGIATLPTTTILGKTLFMYAEYDGVQAKLMCQSTGSYP